MSAVKHDEVRQAVRQRYARVAEQEAEGCGCATECCATQDSDAGTQSLAMGYSAEETAAVPEGADMGLGCGNPRAIASLAPGETVLDLGSGGGFDCFLAARQIGEQGRVIGVDMTPEMVAKARANAERGGYDNVEFRLGEIEHLPVADASVDVIISNCVINLSPDKARVFAEAWRVLRPGGRLAIADVVARNALPAHIREDMALYTGCVGGASTVDEIEQMLRAVGFEDIHVRARDESRAFIRDWAPGTDIADRVVSASIEANRPAK